MKLMINPHIYNLEEFAAQNNIQDVYGAAVACMAIDPEAFRHMHAPGTTPTFYSIVLILDGWQEYLANNQNLKLEMHDLFVTLPYISYFFNTCSNDVASAHLLIEKNYFDEILSMDGQFRDTVEMEIFSAMPVFHLSESKAADFLTLFRQIQKVISQPHLYKNEMVKYLVHIGQLFLAELISGHEVNTHDLKHKDNIFRIFIHLASRYFRKERQVQFYADRMNITSTYLSRTVRELTGNTVYGYLSHFLFNEICIQLKTTEKTISEIAFDLNFSDQSALTNFFRAKTGMSPLAYRKNQKQ